MPSTTPPYAHEPGGPVPAVWSTWRAPGRRRRSFRLRPKHPADRPMHPPANPGFRGRPKSGRLGDVMSYPCPAGMYSALSTSCPPAMPHFVRVFA